MTISCFSPGTTNTTDVVFFDSSFTFSNESIEVGCCDNDMTVTNVTCGKGISCTGQCSAIEASLCPSGNCTGNLEDCGLHQEEEYESTGPAAATGASWEFNWCLPGAARPIYQTSLNTPGCRLSGPPSLCLLFPSDVLLQEAKGLPMAELLHRCGFQFTLGTFWPLSGHSCPKPGSIPNGNWSCQMQDLLIPDGTLLDSDANTYPGE